MHILKGEGIVHVNVNNISSCILNNSRICIIHHRGIYCTNITRNLKNKCSIKKTVTITLESLSYQVFKVPYTDLKILR